MSSVILLVNGDNLPNVQLALTNTTTGAPIDMSAATNGVAATVYVKMRAAGTTAPVTTIPASFVNTGSDGLVQFAFAGNTLNVNPGMYEFEVVINWNGNTQTVYGIFRGHVRQAF
jgi:hypothetical protein